jgi:hypothetical protein
VPAVSVTTSCTSVATVVLMFVSSVWNIVARFAVSFTK